MMNFLQDLTHTTSRGKVKKNDNSTPRLETHNLSFNGTNGSALKGRRKERKYTGFNVSLKETLIDKKILRVLVKRDNLEDLRLQTSDTNKSNRLGRNIIKKRGLISARLKPLASSLESSLIRGRKRKLDITKEISDLLEVKKEEPYVEEIPYRQYRQHLKINGGLRRKEQVGKNANKFSQEKEETAAPARKGDKPRKTLKRVIAKSSEKKPVVALKNIRLVRKSGERIQVKILPPSKLATLSKNIQENNSLKDSKITTPRETNVKILPAPKLEPLKQSSPFKSTLYIQVKPLESTNLLQEPTLVKEKRNGHMHLHQEILYMRPPVANQTQYYLHMPAFQDHYDGILKYKFQTLVSDMKTLKLPSPKWKIKVIIRQNNVAGVTVTNKAELERSVSFYADKNNYSVKIDNRLVHLLGSPGELHSKTDIEILLDILERIDSKNPMVMFK